MSEAISLFQGDSSETFATKVFDENDNQITTLTGYSGRFVLVNTIGGTEYISRAITASGGEFRDLITPTDSAALAVGSYVAIVQISNLSINFRKEDHTPVTIKAQGYNA